MPMLDVVIEAERDLSIRARQVCGMFDCPPEKKMRLDWKCVKSPQSPQSVSSIGKVSRQRPCAVFCYTGPAMDKSDAERLINVPT